MNPGDGVRVFLVYERSLWKTMAEEKGTVLTESGLKKLEEQLDYLISVRRNEISEQIAIALGFGDLSENYEYKAAKQAQNRNRSRIRYLERMIASAKVRMSMPLVKSVDCIPSFSSFNR